MNTHGFGQNKNGEITERCKNAINSAVNTSRLNDEGNPQFNNGNKNNKMKQQANILQQIGNINIINIENLFFDDEEEQEFE